jgi:hypothetical protein
VNQEDGTIVVERADNVILVSTELLSEIDPHYYRDGVLTIDTAGEYRYRRIRSYDQYSDVFERVRDGGQQP